MKTASHTATGVAALRAVHQLNDGDPKILYDPIILNLLDRSMIRYILDNPGIYRHPGLMKLRAHVLLRSRYAEDCLKAAFERGIRQYLVLGAGFDTYAYRQPAWAQDLHIFEADHPASQEQKRRALAAAGIDMPANLSFVPVDFECSSLWEALGKSSFRLDEPVFISWLGVMVYLTMEAIDALLRDVASLEKGSELVFTFTQKRAGGITPIAARAAEAGEPWISYFSPQALREKMESHGFSSLSFLTPEDAAAYFSGRNDGLTASEHLSIAHAGW